MLGDLSAAKAPSSAHRAGRILQVRRRGVDTTASRTSLDADDATTTGANSRGPVVDFRNVNVSWRRWVEAWERDQAGVGTLLDSSWAYRSCRYPFLLGARSVERPVAE